MRKIRSKIIFIFLCAVLLPLFPLSVLVYNLVNQSYRVGVNPRVEEALRNGLRFSKESYDYQRDNLVASLQRFSEIVTVDFEKKNVSTVLCLDILDLDTTFWHPQKLSFLSETGNVSWEIQFNKSHQEFFNPLILQEFKSLQQTQIVVSDRINNQFVALKKLIKINKIFGYLVLEASLDEAYLKRADNTLSVFQVYQTLDLTRHSLPTSFLWAFLVLAIFLLGLVVVIGIWISSKVTAPLSSLTEGVAEIGKGNLDFRIKEIKRKDEIGELASRFNNMAEQLKENQQRLIYLEKISAWQQMARKLAHEIKNPLTPIQLTIQQLVDKYEKNDENYSLLLKECYEIINEEIGSLRQLVTEFSEFGRMPKLDLKTGDLNKLILDVTKLFGNRVQLELEENIPLLPFDQDRIRRVIINLIKNALQADESDNPVYLSSYLKDDCIHVIIEDQGHGIQPNLLEKIFDPYFSTKKEGMGLGLPITRLIVEEHGGKIWAESTPGKGTIFFIKLPIR
jgi:nitrogen fixation/metabolism regulation signal transduction histidine kinase